MKVAITGHTRGIGLAIATYFQENGHEVLGFSKSTGYDISSSEIRDQIAELSNDCDIFVNNAFVMDEENSQFEMLKVITRKWTGQNKTIINISSRSGDSHDDPAFPFPSYAKMKYRLDQYCKVPARFPFIVNLRPGSVDTDMTKSRVVRKMNTSSVVKVLHFILENKDEFLIRSITFTP
jgi:NAD(P)-dependent dehydrogenase (short-subunit alcohol dehydrogenase family)